VADPLDRLPSVTGTVNYLVPTGERPYAHVSAAPPGVPPRRETIAAAEVTIRDARPIAASLTLDAQGFVLRTAPTAVTDFYDADQLRDLYRGEIERLILAETGAEKVVVYGHTTRSVPRASQGVKGMSNPVRHVHNDYSATSGAQLIDDHLDPDEADGRRGRRFAQFNIWRPMFGPLEHTPLAILDARSIAPDDLIVADLIYPDKRSETFSVTANPAHRWFYFPRMRRDEVLIFKCFDSDEAVARFTPHTAFDDPATPADARPRESIEFRALALF
jgi:hypothetical protein